MIRLSRAAYYALTAIVQLSDDPQDHPIPCSQLALAGEMPERFLLQVLRLLVNEGLAVSTRGVEGGYHLARPLDEITLGELIEAIDGPLGVDMPKLGGLTSEANKHLSGVLHEAASAIEGKFASIRLSEFVDKRRRKSA